MLVHKKQHGFTLIELMITLGILAVVAAISIPAYNGYVQTGRITEGWNNLEALKSAQQQFFIENNNYFSGADAAALKAASGSLWIRAEADGSENFLYEVTGASAAGYTATATGTRNLPSSVKLRCVVASGQTSCTKL